MEGIPMNVALSRNLCIVCGLGNPRGMRVPYWRAPEGGSLSVHALSDDWAGYPGLVHGGITTAMMDDLLIWALVAKTGKLSFTVDMHVRFRGPVRTGRQLRLDGWVTSERRSLATAQGTVRDLESGELLVEANARLIQGTREKFREITGHAVDDPEWDPYF